MNEAPAAVSPAPVAVPASVPAPTGAAEPAQAQPAAPEIPADLVAAAAARDAKLQRFAPKSSQASQATEAATETAPPAETTAAEPGQAAETTEAKPADAEPPKDSVADRIAAYLQQERRLKQQQTKLAADRAAVEAERAQIEAAKAQKQKEVDLRELAKKDPYAAVKQLLGDETLRGSFVVDMLNRLSAEESGQVVETDQQREDRIAKQAEERAIARIKAEREAEEKARADARAKEEADLAKKNAAGKEAFFLGLHEQLKADIDKYPYIAANDGIAPGEVDKWMQQQFAQTGKIPSHTEIFTHFNSQYAAEAERHWRSYMKINGGKLPADAAPALAAVKTPVSAVAPIARPDTRGATTTPAPPAKGRNYKQDVAEMARKLDEMDRARSSQVRG